MDKYGGDDIDVVITEGITFKAGNVGDRAARGSVAKVKTKARKKQYITSTHGSASSRKKADIRKKRASRHKSIR